MPQLIYCVKCLLCVYLAEMVTNSCFGCRWRNTLYEVLGPYEWNNISFLMGTNILHNNNVAIFQNVFRILYLRSCLRFLSAALEILNFSWPGLCWLRGSLLFVAYSNTLAVSDYSKRKYLTEFKWKYFENKHLNRKHWFRKGLKSNYTVDIINRTKL